MSADAHDLYKLTRELENIGKQIEQIGPELAKAKTIRDYDSDRRRNLLAEFASKLHPGSISATAAESVARANPEYVKRFKELSQDLMGAYATISREGGLQARFEAARSILSVTKAQLSL